MKVNEIVELCYLRINGGYPTPDNVVLRSDIRFYVPDGVNALMMEYYAGEQAFAPTGAPNPLFLQVFENVAVSLNSVRGKFTFPLPKRALSIPVAQSVRSVGMPSGYLFDHFYPEDGTLDTFYQQISRKEPAYSVEGETVVLYNFPGTSASKVVVKQLVHIDDYASDEDEILVPSGAESRLIDIIYEMVMPQKTNPKNVLDDGREDGQ